MANEIIPTSELVKNIEELFTKTPYREVIFSHSDLGHSFRILENHEEVYKSEMYKDQDDCIFRGYTCLNTMHLAKPLLMETDKVQHYQARKAVKTNGWEGS